MATSTENFKFKKPDESDFYDVQDQNGNWDIADQELEKLNNPTFEDYTGDTSVPAASAAIEELKSKSKLGVLLSNIKAAFKGACLIGHIVNNCVTDNPNLPLSAAQGKALMDAITVLNTKGKIYYASGSKNAEYKVETGLVEVTVPAGKYLVLAANSVTTPNTGQMSCGLGASSGTLIGENTTRTESTSGGGVVNFAYLDTDNISTIKTSGYGYNDESYMYRSILVAIRL